MTPGTIIVINGTSSSGKSSLIAALQTQLAEPFLNAGIDKFIWMLPERYLKRPLWDGVLAEPTQAGELGHTLFSGMHRAIAQLAWAGNNVLADHVIIEQVWADEMAQVFAGLPAYFVGLHCPLAVLETREKQRGDRTLGSARAQFPVIHRYAKYHLELHTDQGSPDDCAARVAAVFGLPMRD